LSEAPGGGSAEIGAARWETGRRTGQGIAPEAMAEIHHGHTERGSRLQLGPVEAGIIAGDRNASLRLSINPAFLLFPLLAILQKPCTRSSFASFGTPFCAFSVSI
jgi:hypothetical protein